ncbi:MoaD/ThiS family protein [Candidatus Woesearchaeota archaeon]|nr:MoaD/ThiS family protein [Candidatus Woesearchaeota archaeon]
MKVFIERENASRVMKFCGSGAELLLFLKQNPESVILVKNGEVVAEDELFSDGDNVKILSVVSGG